MCLARVSVNFAVTFNQVKLRGGGHVVHIKHALLATFL
jgi:hypothetical protein